MFLSTASSMHLLNLRQAWQHANRIQHPHFDTTYHLTSKEYHVHNIFVLWHPLSCLNVNGKLGPLNGTVGCDSKQLTKIDKQIIFNDIWNKLPNLAHETVERELRFPRVMPLDIRNVDIYIEAMFRLHFRNSFATTIIMYI